MLTLDVYLEPVMHPIGKLLRAENGAVSFRYTTLTIPHPISISLPVQAEPFGDVATRAFFENLVFENAVREQIMQRHGIEQTDIVGLLFHLGKDCPGAISVVPEGEPPGKRPGNLSTDYEQLGAKELQLILKSLRDHRRMPDGTRDPSPLAGVQGKIAVTVMPNGCYALPKVGSGAPTTHILKVPRRNQFRLIDHENFLMRIAGEMIDHPVAETSIVGDDEERGLLIKRYDRIVGGDYVNRIHQEDFCQALGLGPTLKYQRYGIDDHCFTASRVGTLIQQCAVPAYARQAFFFGTLMNLMLGNTDNHAKNHSLVFNNELNPERPNLAPFYDIVPALADPEVTHQLSFDIGEAQMTDEITEADLRKFARDLGYRNYNATMKRRLKELAAAVAARIGDMQGPARKLLGDVMAEQVRGLRNAIGSEVDVPERDLVIINRA